MLKAKPVLLAIILIAAATVWWQTTHGSGHIRPTFRHSSLAIIRADNKFIPFAVEVAASIPEQTYGLMFIKSLADDEGMIFPYTPPKEVSFWMKNTLISLDMLFVRPDGTIGRIVSQARPQDLTPLSSGEPVIAVLEIKGGMAQKDGIAVGDRVQSPILNVSQ